MRHAGSPPCPASIRMRMRRRSQRQAAIGLTLQSHRRGATKIETVWKPTGMRPRLHLRHGSERMAAALRDRHWAMGP